MDMAEENISSGTINRKITALRSYFKFLQMQGGKMKNPMAKIIAPKMAKRKTDFISEDEMMKILDEEYNADDFDSLRNHLIIEILYSTGMRRAELAGLEESDISFYDKTVKVFGKRRKERIIPLNERTLELIGKYLDMKRKCGINNTSFLVNRKGKALSVNQIYTIVHNILLPYDIEKKSPHVFRHTCATHLINHGAEINNVKNLLGHASLTTTQVYTHTTIEILKREYKENFKGV